MIEKIEKRKKNVLKLSFAEEREKKKMKEKVDREREREGREKYREDDEVALVN